MYKYNTRNIFDENGRRSHTTFWWGRKMKEEERRCRPPFALHSCAASYSPTSYAMSWGGRQSEQVAHGHGPEVALGRKGNEPSLGRLWFFESCSAADH